MDPDKLPTHAVRHFMTTDPVTARPATPVGTLARTMLDAHIHRVIVVYEERRPVGVVSTTDLPDALADPADAP